MSLRIIATGGTFDKHYDPIEGALRFSQTHIHSILERCRLTIPVAVTELPLLDSLDMQETDRERIVAACSVAAEPHIVIVHGTDRADAVVRISDVLFGSGSYSELTQDDFQMLKQELPTVESHIGAELTELLVAAQLATSKGDARRFLQSNAIYINGQQLPLEKQHIDKTDVINGYAIIRRGKNATALLEIK